MLWCVVGMLCLLAYSKLTGKPEPNTNKSSIIGIIISFLCMWPLIVGWALVMALIQAMCELVEIFINIFRFFNNEQQ